MKLFRKLSLPTAAILSLSMLLSSCGNVAQSAGSIGQRGTVGEFSYDGKERQILGQARIAGAVLGGAAGYMIAKNNGRNTTRAALGGAALGGLLGNAVGHRQASNARSKRLSNNNLRSLIAKARSNNNRLAAYNRKVARRLAAIRAAAPSDRAKMAKTELKSVNRALNNANKMVKDGNKVQYQLAGAQRNQYAPEIRRQKAERNKLAGYRNELAREASVASR